jgi:2-keto-4-pentenoate hydratase/2-oxohepta-3-ene-1,7-dioic acid hydratase in catechol pathway
LYEASLPLLSPVPENGKTICIGLNYRDHAIETGAEIPTEPVVFSKLQGTLCGPGTPIPLPAVSHQVDYEAELVLVIGRTAQSVSEETADEYIFGYMCGHDVSARDWQKGRPGGQWLLGKSFPQFAPVGPWLVTKEQVKDACNLKIQMRINDEVMQDSNTQQLIFKPQQLISYLSRCCILQAGDLIFTGTPPGVGAARKPPRFLRAGDICEVEIEGLGVLRNPVVEAQPAQSQN